MPNQTLRRAAILAAGRGSRMGVITQHVPKPMLPVAGKPILEHIIERLAAAGIHEFCVIVGYGRQHIESHFKNSPHALQLLVQDPVDGTGSAALLARSFTGEEPFLLTFGDILCDPSEYTRCVAVLENHPATAAVLAVKEVEDPWQGAAVYELAGRVSRIVEKPAKGTSVTRWNSAGFYAFRPVVFSYLQRLEKSPRGEYELTSALDLMLADRLELRISPVSGSWRDVGRPEDLAAVNEAAS